MSLTMHSDQNLLSTHNYYSVKPLGQKYPNDIDCDMSILLMVNNW